MVRNFKGVVKVAEVQEEFDNLLNTINAKIDTYNSSLNIEDVDYNNGGTDLAPYGYTLSIGGLKKVLDAYDGAILGANVLRISNNQYIVSEGLYIKDRTVTKLPSKVLTGTGDKVYYDSEGNSYTFSDGSSGEINDDLTIHMTLYIAAKTTVADFITNDTLTIDNLRDGQFESYSNYYDYTFPVTIANRGDGQFAVMQPVFPVGYNPSTDCIFAYRIDFVYDNQMSNISSDNWGIGYNYLQEYYQPTYSDQNTGFFVVPSTYYSRSLVLNTGISYDRPAGNYDEWHLESIPDGTNYASIYGVTIDANHALAPYPNVGFRFVTTYYKNAVPASSNILISPINKNRISRLCNRPNATNEEIPDYKVTIESKNSGYVINGNQYLSNSDKGQFYSGSAGRNCRINLFDTQVAYHQWHGDRTDSYHEPFNFMFIPKGIPNPYNGLAGEIRFAMQKVWNYILQRPSR